MINEDPSDTRFLLKIWSKSGKFLKKMQNEEIKTIDLIQKLLRLSDPEKNSYPNEAKIAWDKAFEISEKYGINLSEIDQRICSIYSYTYDIRISISGIYPVAGFQFYEGVIYKGKMKINDLVALKPEFDNIFDKHAVAVFWNQIMIGYIPRKRNSAISDYLLTERYLFGTIISISKEKIGWGEVEISIKNPIN